MSQSDIFISVVIPCYNDGKYLGETLSHLKKQTYKNFEIIIVNDGSNDPFTIEYLNNLNEVGLKVYHKENGKMSSARNFGVTHAKGNVIVCLDADDYFDRTFFEKGLNILNENPKVAVVSSYIKMFGEVNKIVKPRGGNVYNFLFNNECSACAMIRKSCWEEINGYDENMIMGYEDWDFYIRITKKGWKIHIIKEKLLYYRQSSKSTHKNKTIPNRLKIINYLVNKHKDWYLKSIVNLIDEKNILYTESRVSYQRIWKMIINRILPD